MLKSLRLDKKYLELYNFYLLYGYVYYGKIKLNLILRGVEMRAPYQILAIPNRTIKEIREFCIFHRADFDQWQFIAGGGEDDETPIEAAKREILEETGIEAQNITQLVCTAYIPAEVIVENKRRHWDKNTVVIKEYL